MKWPMNILDEVYQILFTHWNIISCLILLICSWDHNKRPGFQAGSRTVAWRSYCKLSPNSSLKPTGLDLKSQDKYKWFLVQVLLQSLILVYKLQTVINLIYTEYIGKWFLKNQQKLFSVHPNRTHLCSLFADKSDLHGSCMSVVSKCKLIQANSPEGLNYPIS